MSLALAPDYATAGMHKGYLAAPLGSGGMIHPLLGPGLPAVPCDQSTSVVGLNHPEGVAFVGARFRTLARATRVEEATRAQGQPSFLVLIARATSADPGICQTADSIVGPVSAENGTSADDFGYLQIQT